MNLPTDNSSNLTIDCGYIPSTAGLGDRVWKDIDGNGIQNCTDTNGDGILGNAGDSGTECLGSGIPGVTVYLVDCLTSGILATTTTDANGFYLFPNLDTGTYCVKFDLNTVPDVCPYGVPQFTTANQGADDAKDSDANPATGVTSGVALLAGQTNRTVDAGILCPGPAALGDRVWKDINGDGIQNCTDTNGDGILGNAGDSGTECLGAGIPGVTVYLVNCQLVAFWLRRQRMPMDFTFSRILTQGRTV